ncbi:PepSY domain-containing protein [Microlunatus sp. Gsoil 973]|uniref:PepSY domain-containing protein n=1 Tax=Microlunatus sp. Gsoil 973 TaxID=2672569 RepID=UPI0012B46787|nr:PepSY domain-containing protein [Microlunatus sp. Gsoil 973]QGN34954.1 hypothetical protein GJV80_21390 [Microlunatus sp. Gsoil 973]
MQKPVRIAVISGAATLALLGGSTVAALAAPNQPTDTGATKISKSRAVTIAKHRIPGARVTEVEVEREHGRTFFEVELVKHHKEYEVLINARTGKVVSAHRDRDDDGHHGRHRHHEHGDDHKHDRGQDRGHDRHDDHGDDD